jgi:hypothetical protein
LPLGDIRAPFIAFFDADDVMRPGNLIQQLALLKRHPRWAALTADYQNFSAAGPYPTTHFGTCPVLASTLAALLSSDEPSLAPAATLEPLVAKRLLVRENFSITGALVLRTSCVQQAGGFDTSLSGSEDFDLLWRVLNLGGSLGVSSHIAFDRRIHTGNTTNSIVKMLKFKVLSRRKLLAMEVDETIRSELSGAIAEFSEALAYEQLRRDWSGGLDVFAHALFYGALAHRIPWMALKALLWPKRYRLAGGRTR